MDFTKINNDKKILNDSRNFSSYQPGTEIDNQIKTVANITQNNEYRNFLIKNAETIIKNNQEYLCRQVPMCSFSNTGITKTNNSTPYIFNELSQDIVPYGYQDSDLKRYYLSREKLNSEKYSPSIYFKK